MDQKEFESWISGAPSVTERFSGSATDGSYRNQEDLRKIAALTEAERAADRETNSNPAVVNELKAEYERARDPKAKAALLDEMRRQGVVPGGVIPVSNKEYSHAFNQYAAPENYQPPYRPESGGADFGGTLKSRQSQEASDASPVSTSIGRGIKGLTHSAGLAMDNMLGDSESATQRILDKQKYDLENPAPSSSQKFASDWDSLADNDYAGMFATVLKNPTGTFNMMLEQTPNSLPGMAFQLTAGIGSKGLMALGPVGAAAGLGIQGLAAFAGNFLPEGGAFIEEQLRNDGVDTTDPIAVKQWIEANRGKNFTGGATKAGVISATDAVTGWMGMKLLAGPSVRFAKAEKDFFARAGVKMDDAAALQAARSSQAYKQAMQPFAADLVKASEGFGMFKRGVGATALDALGEGVGEYAGTYAATGDASAKEAVLEGLMGVGQGTAMSAGQYGIGKLSGSNQGMDALKGIASTPVQQAKPHIKPNSPLSNAASVSSAVVQANQPPQVTPQYPDAFSPNATDDHVALIQQRDSWTAEIASLQDAIANPQNAAYQNLYRQQLEEAIAERDRIVRQLQAVSAYNSGRTAERQPDQELLDLIAEEKKRQEKQIKSVWLDQHIKRTTQGPTQNFAGMVEYENFLKSELDDIAQRRAEAKVTNDKTKAQEAQMAEERLKDIARHIEEGRDVESAKKRNALLDSVLSSNPQNAKRAFDRALRLEGYRDTAFSDAEMAKIARFEELRQMQEQQAVQSPNEGGSFGIPERKEAPRGKFQHIHDMLNSGWRLQGKQLVSRDGKKYNLKNGELAVAKAKSKQAAPKVDGQQAPVEQVATGQAPKRAYIPPKSNDEARDRWVHGYQPTSSHGAIKSAVAKALDSGLFYNRQVEDFVANELGVTEEEREVGSKTYRDENGIVHTGVEGGSFGYDVYLARREVERERQEAVEREAGKRLDLRVGEKIGKLKFQDGKIGTAVTVEEVHEFGATIIFTRGPQKLRSTPSFTSIERYAKEAGNDYFERKQEKSNAPRTEQVAPQEAQANDEEARTEQAAAPEAEGIANEGSEWQSVLQAQDAKPTGVQDQAAEQEPTRNQPQVSVHAQEGNVERKAAKPISKWTAEELQARLARGNLSDESRAKLEAELAKRPVAPAERERKDEPTFTVGKAPGDAQPVSVRNGVVYIGDEPVIDYDTEEDVRVKAGVTNQEIADAIRSSGQLGSRRFFGLAPKRDLDAIKRKYKGEAVAEESNAESVSNSQTANKAAAVETENSKDSEQVVKLKKRIAEAEQRTAVNPTEAQKESGNYVKGKFPWNGMTIAIETPKGAERSGIGEDGQEWRVVAPVSYGYFLGTKGADKEHLDVYIGEKPESDSVFVINQTKVDSSKFDEHKVLIGFGSSDEAKTAYFGSFTDGFAPRVFGSITGPYSVAEFKEALPKMEKAKPLTDRVESSPKPEEASEPAEFEYAGYKIYQNRISIQGEGVKTMWAVQTEDNRQKGRVGFGDSLFDTKEQAIAAADRQVRDADARREYEAKKKEREEAEAQKQAAIKADNYNGFLDGMNQAKQGLVRKVLDKQWRFDGNDIMTARQRIEKLKADGTLEVSTIEEPKIKPMSRAQFNRASQREQDAHEKKMREAGNKTTYLVNGSELGKIAYDYANYLLGNADNSVPLDQITVTRSATLDGKPVEYQQKADEAISEIDKQMTLGKQLLECLAS